MNLYLLRHGETEWNRVKRLQGRTDIPLNENGRAQMRRAADILAGLDTGIDRIFSSPLGRARESAAIVAERLCYPKEEIVTEKLLIERCFGAGEGLTAEQGKERFPDGLFPDMETSEEIAARARAMFLKIAGVCEDRENILLVAHGAIFHALMSALVDGRFAWIGREIIRDQGNVYRIRYGADRTAFGRYDREKKGFAELDVYEGRVI